MEMPGLWKPWKAKNRLPTLSTSPLEISPKAGEIPTFPQLRRRRRMEKWKTKSRFPTFPPPRLLSQKEQDRRRRASPSAQGAVPRPSVVPFYSAQVGNFHSALDTSLREKFFDVTIGERILQIPTHRAKNDGWFEVSPFEWCRSWFAHWHPPTRTCQICNTSGRS